MPNLAVNTNSVVVNSIPLLIKSKSGKKCTVRGVTNSQKRKNKRGGCLLGKMVVNLSD